jgi:hypothetical protein
VSAQGFAAHGTYQGPRHDLKGKSAQLTVYEATGRCLATFDDPDTGYAMGVHDFQTDHFVMDDANG